MGILGWGFFAYSGFWYYLILSGFALKGESLSCLQQQESNQRNAAPRPAFFPIDTATSGGSKLLAGARSNTCSLIPARCGVNRGRFEGGECAEPRPWGTLLDFLSTYCGRRHAGDCGVGFWLRCLDYSPSHRSPKLLWERVLLVIRLQGRLLQKTTPKTQSGTRIPSNTAPNLCALAGRKGACVRASLGE